MRIGFLAHPTTRRQKEYIRAVDLMNKLIDEGEHGYRRETWSRSTQVPYVEAGVVRSVTGAECSALLYELPFTAEDIAQDVGVAQRSVAQAVEVLASEGAGIVGLGGATSIVGGRGVVTAREASVPVTSGNALTAFAAHAQLMHVFDVLGLERSRTRVVVVGYPGSVGLAVARLLARDRVPIDLVHSGRASIDVLQRHLGRHQGTVEFFSDLEVCYDRAHFFVTATSVGNVLDERRLSPGSVVIDVALPRDVRQAHPPRRDVLTIDGGFVNVREGGILGARMASISVNRHLNACLGETILLGLEGRAECYSIGRDINIDKVTEIGAVAAKHGFDILPMSSWDEPITDDDVLALARHQGAGSPVRASPAQAKADALTNYRRYSDRLLVDHMEFNYIDTVVGTGQGAYVSSHDGQYLDMDACHGAALLGHNAPEIVSGLQSFLAEGRATAVVCHVAIPPRSADLCRRISNSIPGPDRSVALTTSGVEAVECAKRTAMAATGRMTTVTVDMLGPLPGEQASSLVTTMPGLLPPDLPTIIAALDSEPAALIVEPLFDEISSPSLTAETEFYATLQGACRDRGVVMIADERHTAMRAAPFLASQRLGLDPDIVCFGESLSGASVPIGASCVRQDVWELASAHFPGSPVAMSPLGGNEFAATAALAMLDKLEDGALWQRSRQVGTTIYEGLAEIVATYPLARRALGAGFLWHLRCGAPLNQALHGLRDDMTVRSPGALRRMIRELPVEVREAATHWNDLFADALEQFLFDRINTKMEQDHQILIDRTRRTPLTLLISPPLTITGVQAEQFVGALDQVMHDLSTFDVIHR